MILILFDMQVYDIKTQDFMFDFQCNQLIIGRVMFLFQQMYIFIDIDSHNLFSFFTYFILISCCLNKSSLNFDS
jgi:hypothetical protein